MSVREIISPYFFKDETSRASTVTSERYAEMLNNFMISELQNFSDYLTIKEQGSSKMDIFIHTNNLKRGIYVCVQRSELIIFKRSYFL